MCSSLRIESDIRSAVRALLVVMILRSFFISPLWGFSRIGKGVGNSFSYNFFVGSHWMFLRAFIRSLSTSLLSLTIFQSTEILDTIDPSLLSNWSYLYTLLINSKAPFDDWENLSFSFCAIFSFQYRRVILRAISPFEVIRL